MKELEKILEEIKAHRNFASECGNFNVASAFELCVEIIRNHMDHASDRWIPVEERLPEKPENGYQEPEYNVMIKDAIIPTTLKFTSKGKWKDDLGQEYEIIAWRPLPEPYRQERSEK